MDTRAFPCLAKVEKTYTAADKYCADCRGLNPDGSEAKTLYVEALVPKLVGAVEGGIWLAPAEGSLVLLNFLDGERSRPVIAALIGGKTEIEHPENELIIKMGQTELRLADKVILKNASASLGALLGDIASLSTELKTIGAPSPHSLSPDLIAKWEILGQKVEGLFKE